MSDLPLTDAIGRTPIATGMKRLMAESLAAVPPNRRAVVLVMGNGETRNATAFVAARVGERDTFKVAGGGGFDFGERRPYGWMAVEIAL